MQPRLESGTTGKIGAPLNLQHVSFLITTIHVGCAFKHFHSLAYDFPMFVIDTIFNFQPALHLELKRNIGEVSNIG